MWGNKAQIRPALTVRALSSKVRQVRAVFGDANRAQQRLGPGEAVPMGERQVGVDLGGTTFTVALVDRRGQIDIKSEHDTLADQGADAVMGRIADAIRALLRDAGVALGDLSGIGLGIPGLHDAQSGTCVYASNLKWRNVPVRDVFQSWFDLPVVVENDVRCAALGEQHFGAGRGVEDMVLVTLGTGVGGAIIMGGRLQRGGGGFAGEVGHQTIETEGMICSCGNRGCLEAYAGVSGIVTRARAAYARHPSERIAELTGGRLESLTPRHLSEAANAGDETARWILAETGRYLGIGLGNIVSVLHPDRIVVGGGVARAGELILAPLREEIARRVPVAMDSTEVVYAELGPSAGVIGASTLVWSNVV